MEKDYKKMWEALQEKQVAKAESIAGNNCASMSHAQMLSVVFTRELLKAMEEIENDPGYLIAPNIEK